MDHIKPIELPNQFEQECEALRIKIFSAVAHDLRTPLACMIGALETIELMKSLLSTLQRDALVKIALAEAHRLDGFIKEMLDKVA
jgi:two-component system sensor histidine kinase KdpD